MDEKMYRTKENDGHIYPILKSPPRPLFGISCENIEIKEVSPYPMSYCLESALETLFNIKRSIAPSNAIDR